ncbi:MAG: hypothetical protein GY943_02240 [Chloroflexi bacterium]|nr:hypothetical protein [Chloroflexota bacterium]
MVPRNGRFQHKRFLGMVIISQLTQTELHIHIAGSYSVENFLELGQLVYQDVAWNGRNFLDEYNDVLNSDLDPIALFETAVHNPEQALRDLKSYYLFDETDSGVFERFMSKFRFFQRIWSYGWENNATLVHKIMTQITQQHRLEGINYIEYRSGFWGEPAEKIQRIKRCAELLQEAAQIGLTAKYIVPLPRTDPLTDYLLVRRLLKQYPHLVNTIVGVDFASFEEGFPPKLYRAFFQQLHQDNEQTPSQALDVVYHVGESYFDKSLESAIRWCHEAAEFGAKRLGHCIALGLDPAVAISRRPHAHEQELVSERLDQIAYDLRFQQSLTAYGIKIDETQLLAEQRRLLRMDGDAVVERPYFPTRLQEIRQRQQFVLDQFVQMGIVIECCPTSNLRIGGVPDAAHHPIHRFLASNVNLVICTDDPGVFGITLASEIEWVLQNSNITPDTLLQRLEDPHRFRLGQNRRFTYS